LRFIDWIMRLPDELERDFWQDIYKYEEEKNMPYVLSVERFALERGIKQGIEKGELLGIKKLLLDALKIKYGEISDQLIESINNVNDAEVLRILHHYIIKCSSIEEFEEKMRLVIR